MQHRLVGQQVLVVGPGWLGGAAALALHAEGARIWTLRRGADAAAGDNITPLVGDVRTVTRDMPASAEWEHALPAQLDHVVVTIAPGRHVTDDHRSVYPAAVSGALALALRHRARSVLYTSSTGVYGGRDGQWVHEGDALVARDARQQALIDAEERLQHVTDTECSRTILRPAGLYGPGRDPAHRYRSSVPTDDADGWTNFSWRDDVIEAIIRSLVSPPLPNQCAVFNCTDGTPLRASVIARALGATASSGPSSTVARSNQRVDSRALIATGWRPSMPTALDGIAALGHPVNRAVLLDEQAGS